MFKEVGGNPTLCRNCKVRKLAKTLDLEQDMLSERQTRLYTKEALHRAEINVSDILESHGIPDSYVWKINRYGKLIPENDKTPIENIILRNNVVGELEYKAFLKIQERAPYMNTGDYVLWISPTHPVYYPDASKIIITRCNGVTFLNKAIVTDWDVMGSIIAAREFAGLSNVDPFIFKKPNDVRATPIFINREKEEELGFALKRMLYHNTIEMMENGEDIRIKQRFIEDSLSGKEVIYGNEPRSCPNSMENSAFNVFAGRDEFGSLQFKCPHCHKINTRERGKLLSQCQHCREDVRC